MFTYRMILDGVAGMKFLIDGQAKDTWAVLRAHFSFYMAIPQLKKKEEGY